MNTARLDFLDHALAAAPTALDRARRAVGVLRAACRPEWDVLMDPPVYWETMATELAGFPLWTLATAVTAALSVEWPGGLPAIGSMRSLCHAIQTRQDPDGHRRAVALAEGEHAAFHQQRAYSFAMRRLALLSGSRCLAGEFAVSVALIRD